MFDKSDCNQAVDPLHGCTEQLPYNLLLLQDSRWQMQAKSVWEDFKIFELPDQSINQLPGPASSHQV